MAGIAIPDDWTLRLTDAIAATVREAAPTLGAVQVVVFAVDCHPWHGAVELSVLTVIEAATDPQLDDPAEMAAWQHFNFTARMSSWEPVAALGREMRAAYTAAADPAGVAEAFMRACAVAAASPQVTAALNLLSKATGFRVSVSHPDDGREFFPPK